MEGEDVKQLEWIPDLGRIVIRFPYDPMLVTEVKTIPGRRWHRDQKIWSVPLERVGEAARILLPLGFEPTPQVEKILNGEVEGLAGLAQQVEEAANQDESYQDGWSVSRLNEAAREALVQSVPATIWLHGEVLEFDRGRHRQHVFFRIVDKAEEDDRPSASVTAVLFQGQKERILERFRETGTELTDGLQVRVQVKVDLYVQNGSFQVVVEDIDPSYTLGEIARRRERILEQVRREGLEDRNRSLVWPPAPLRVGVLTSPGSDAWKDLIHQLDCSGYAFQVTLYGVHVQGERTEADVLAGLEYFEQRASEFDVLLMVRGGGSRADLMAFDSLPLALAVARHSLKIVVGIGHQADRSVLDELAHSEKTPTAAGQQLVERVGGFWEGVRDRVLGVMSAAQRLLMVHRAQLDSSRSQVVHTTRNSLLEQQHSLQFRIGRIGTAASRCIGEERGALKMKRRRLMDLPLRIIGGARQLRGERSRQILARAQQRLTLEEERIGFRTVQLRGADPRTILARGFSWVRDGSGRTISSADGVSPGDKIEVHLADGVLDATVESSRDEASGDLSS